MRNPILPLLLVSALAAPAAADEGEPLDTTERWYEWSLDFGRQLREERRRTDAIQEWQVCATLDPTRLEPCVEGALDAVRAGSEPGAGLTGDYYHLAENFLRQGVPRGGEGNAGLAYVIGRLRLVDGDWGMAHYMLNEADKGGLALPDLDLGAWLLRATVNRATLLIDGHAIKEAVTSLNDVLKRFGEAPGVTDRDIVALKINLASAHRDRDERIVAQRILDEVVKEGKATSRVYDLLGEILADQGRMAEALDAYRRAMESSLDRQYADPLLHAGMALLKSQPPNLDEADAVLDQYLLIRPDDGDAIAIKGMVAHERGGDEDLAQAVRHFRRASRLKPKSYEVLTKLVSVLAEMGRLEEAEEVKKQLRAMRRDAVRKANPTEEEILEAESGAPKKDAEAEPGSQDDAEEAPAEDPPGKQPAPAAEDDAK